MSKPPPLTALGQHNDNFVCCPPEALDWTNRRYRILEEIIEYSPDIICLQVSLTSKRLSLKNMEVRRLVKRTA